MLKPATFKTATQKADTTLATNLEEHGPLLTYLRNLVYDETGIWPADDKSSTDQLPANYDLQNEILFGVEPASPKLSGEVAQEPQNIGTQAHAGKATGSTRIFQTPKHGRAEDPEESPSKRLRSRRTMSSKPLPALGSSSTPMTLRLRTRGSTQSSTSSKTLIASGSSKGKSVAR